MATRASLNDVRAGVGLLADLMREADARSARPNEKVSAREVRDLNTAVGDGAELDAATTAVRRYAAERLGNSRRTPSLDDVDQGLGDGMRAIARASRRGRLSETSYDRLAPTWQKIVDFAVKYRGQSIDELTQPEPAAPVPPFTAGHTGVRVDLEGVQAEVMRLDPAAAGLARTPSYYPTFVSAYHVEPAVLREALARSELLAGAAFAGALEINDWLTADQVAIAATDPRTLGATLFAMLEGHVTSGVISAADARRVRADHELIGRSMIADGATHAFTTRYEESGDYSYVGVVTANTETGALNIAGIRRDPE